MSSLSAPRGRKTASIFFTILEGGKSDMEEEEKLQFSMILGRRKRKRNTTDAARVYNQNRSLAGGQKSRRRLHCTVSPTRGRPDSYTTDPASASDAILYGGRGAARKPNSRANNPLQIRRKNVMFLPFFKKWKFTFVFVL